MKRICFVLGTLMALSCSSRSHQLSSLKNQEADESTRKATFHELIRQITVQSEVSPLRCSRKDIDVIASRPGNIVYKTTAPAYRITQTEEPSYQDAFNLAFADVNSTHIFSTLIAYEGHNNFVMGRLSVKREPDGGWKYATTFLGFLTEVVTVITDPQGIPTKLLYQTRNPSNIIFVDVRCSIRE